MNKQEMINYIVDTYAVEAEFPWQKYPENIIFRHKENQKWFALLMSVEKTKLGLTEDGMLDIMNVKCDPALIGSFQAEQGIYPAYHMNKANWISIALDGSVKDEKVKILLDMSFELTAKKNKRVKNSSKESSGVRRKISDRNGKRIGKRGEGNVQFE